MKSPRQPNIEGRAPPDAGSGRRNPGLELFFDLVFVLCVARLADRLHAEPSWTTAGIVLLIFVPVWWTWTSVTFAIDRFPDDRNPTTLLVLLAAAASGLMALAIPTMPGADDTWFAVGYLSVRLVLVLFYLRARTGDERLTRFYAAVFAVTAAIWFVSIFLPTRVHPFVWGVALLVDILVPLLAHLQNRILPVDEAHLPERFGAFAIIVLGESAVNTVAVTETPLRPSVALLIAEGFVLSGLLWWGFFDRRAWQIRYRALAGEAGSGRIAYVVCAVLHFPLVVGITLVGAGLQIVVEHGRHDVPDAAALLVAGGIAAYLLTLNLMTWVLHTPRSSSITGRRFLLLAALAVLLGVGRGLPSAVFLAGCAAVLGVHVLANVRRAQVRTVGPAGDRGGDG